VQKFYSFIKKKIVKNCIFRRIREKTYFTTYPLFEYPIIRRRRGGRILEVPTSLLYTQISNADEVESVTDEWLRFSRNRENLPIINFNQHIDFIEFIFDPTKGSIDEYLDSWKKVFMTRNIVPSMTVAEMIERRRTFCRRIIKKGVAKELNRWPVRVDRFERDHFNLYDGHHRLALAVFFRVNHVRVECPQDIYDRFLMRRTSGVNKVIGNRIKRNESLPQPIDIPGYYGIRVDRNCTEPLDIIRRWLGGHLKGCRTLLDVDCNIGYFCHHFERQGMETFGIDRDSGDIELALVLNNAYGLQSRFEQMGLEDMRSEKSYDIVLALAALSDVVDRLKVMTYSEVSEILEKLTKRYLFWESGHQPEREKKAILKSEGFKNYMKLGNSFWAGQVREIGVFSK
jgi:2-polyprenyl-3-methyl-5-hydroxy-6-metoxy-1,4-benzoquinol methylase